MVFDVTHESGARGLERRDFVLDGLQLFTIVDDGRGGFQPVMTLPRATM